MLFPYICKALTTLNGLVTAIFHMIFKLLNLDKLVTPFTLLLQLRCVKFLIMLLHLVFKYDLVTIFALFILDSSAPNFVKLEVFQVY